MKNVRLFFAALRQSQTLKAGVSERAVVVSPFVASHCWNGFDADAKEIVRKRLEERQRFRDQLAMPRQVVRVARLSQTCDLLFHGHSFQIIFLLRVNARDVFPHCVRERRLGEEFRPRSGVHAGDQSVFPKRFLVEKCGRPHLGIELLIVSLVKLFRSDADLLNQSLCDRTILSRTFDGLCSAVTQHYAATGAEFVALGVSAEVIVIVEDQNANIFSCALAKKISGRQPADTSANNHDVVALPRIYWLSE